MLSAARLRRAGVPERGGASFGTRGPCAPPAAAAAVERGHAGAQHTSQNSLSASWPWRKGFGCRAAAVVTALFARCLRAFRPPCVCGWPRGATARRPGSSHWPVQIVRALSKGGIEPHRGAAWPAQRLVERSVRRLPPCPGATRAAHTPNKTVPCQGPQAAGGAFAAALSVKCPYD